MDNAMEDEDVSVGDEVEKCEPFTAEIYAAKALAADMDPWIKCDPRKTPRAEFESWLETNKPSQVSRYGDEDGGRGPVGWICVKGPGPHSRASRDVDSLLESWDCLLESGRPVNFQTVKELALNHSVLTGKWLIYLESGFKVDHAWECIARATLEGKIYCAKVSTQDPTNPRHVICVFNTNFTDENQVMRLETVIRAAGVKCVMSYKPNVYTHLGIYRNNRWKLSPTIYVSKFDLECVPRRSHVFNKVTNLEVT